jgi:hypothetical protein
MCRDTDTPKTRSSRVGNTAELSEQKSPSCRHWPTRRLNRVRKRAFNGRRRATSDSESVPIEGASRCSDDYVKICRKPSVFPFHDE